MSKALEGLDFVESKYLAAIEIFFNSLASEVVIWKKLTEGQDYLKPVLIPEYTRLLTRHRINMARQLLTNRDFFTLFRIVFLFFKRRLSVQRERNEF
jgi:hypothetical protein